MKNKAVISPYSISIKNLTKFRAANHSDSKSKKAELNSSSALEMSSNNKSGRYIHNQKQQPIGKPFETIEAYSVENQ
jgi:hypothetical protein